MKIPPQTYPTPTQAGKQVLTSTQSLTRRNTMSRAGKVMSGHTLVPRGVPRVTRVGGDGAQKFL